MQTPPRTIADITALLDQYKPDPAKAAEWRTQAEATPPADAGPAELIAFHNKRAAAREALGLTAPMLEDRRKLVELARGLANSALNVNQLAVSKQTAGNFLTALELREALIKDGGAQAGARRAAAYQGAGLYAVLGDLARARELIALGDSIFNRSAGAPAWRPVTTLFAALREGSQGAILRNEGKFAEAEAAARRRYCQIWCTRVDQAVALFVV